VFIAHIDSEYNIALMERVLAVDSEDHSSIIKQSDVIGSKNKDFIAIPRDLRTMAKVIG